MKDQSGTVNRLAQDTLYAEASSAHGAAIRRLARGYEADPERPRDLLQEIQIELWRSLELFDGRCSLQTWVYRISHNVGASHIVRSRRSTTRLVDLETIESLPSSLNAKLQANRHVAAGRLLGLIYQLKPLDRQVMLLHLEGEIARSIAAVTGISAGNVAVKINRITKLLTQQYSEGATRART